MIDVIDRRDTHTHMPHPRLARGLIALTGSYCARRGSKSGRDAAPLMREKRKKKNRKESMGGSDPACWDRPSFDHSDSDGEEFGRLNDRSRLL